MWPRPPEPASPCWSTNEYLNHPDLIFHSDINERELQVDGISLDGRGSQRLPGNDTGNTLGEKSYSFPQMHIGQQRDALQQVGIGTRATDSEIWIIIAFEPFPQLTPASITRDWMLNSGARP
jgi:hypothetical protein